VEKNLAVNVVRPSHNHMARNNAIRNNVFLCDGDMQITLPRCSGFTFEKNELSAKGKITFDNYEGVTQAAGNVLYTTQGKIECRKLDQYSQTGSYTLESGDTNVQADPKLSVDEGKVMFAPDSPARNAGIEPIDVSAAGPRP
jgi:hypothetical protein